MPTLTWIGKDAVTNHHQEVPYHLLRDVPELGCGPPDTGNLIVEGDNLTALKALLPYYAGQVKCIYIDPPYNTGNEGWVYNDNVNSPEIKAWLGKVVGKEAEDLSRHDKWLCMMYPRLRLLKDMLREDGAIFISIDDAEVANLRTLCDEIFGRQNLLANLVWEKGKKGDAKFFSVSHEYILVYARSKALLTSRNTVWRRRKPGVDEALAKYQELKSAMAGNHADIRKEMMAWYRSLPANNGAKAHKHYNWSDDRGLYFPDNFHGPDDGRETRPRYDILHPVTGKPVAKPSTGWRWEESRTIAALADKPPRIHFGPDEATIPCRKSYLFEVDEEPFPSVFYKDGRAATLEVERLLGKGAFEFPKDSGIIADILSLVCKDGDLVLDSFAGSGTTAHACEILRKERNVNLRCILVELDKVTVNANAGTVTLAAPLTELEIGQVAAGFIMEANREKFVAAARAHAKGVEQIFASPAERGVSLTVPVFSIERQGVLEMLDETHFLERPWHLMAQQIGEDPGDLAVSGEAGSYGSIGLDAAGKVKWKFGDELADELKLIEVTENWSEARLIDWLDRNIPHPDISADETGPFINAILTILTQKKEFSFGRLVRERFVLRDYVEQRIADCRKLAKAEAFQDVLFAGKIGPIKVSAKQVFAFDPDRYPARWVCERSSDFKKHYHRQVGELGEKGEEFECAQFLDQLPEVDTWVRNLERQPERSFWLPTATDRFYPDFVCKLTDGRILVVESKGEHLWSNDDSKEKRRLGELWAERSGSQCLFVMPKGKDFSAIRKAL